MTERTTSAEDRAQGRGDRDSHAPERPTQLPGGSWWAAVKRTVREFQVDNLSDRAAALTYYSVLSIFPALLVVISLVDLAGPGTIQRLLANLGQVAPGSVNQILATAIENLQRTRGSAGLLALVSLATALWLASRYIAAFMRASNAIYDVPEGRPVWKTLPIRHRGHRGRHGPAGGVRGRGRGHRRPGRSPRPTAGDRLHRGQRLGHRQVAGAAAHCGLHVRAAVLGLPQRQAAVSLGHPRRDPGRRGLGGRLGRRSRCMWPTSVPTTRPTAAWPA